MSQNMCPEYVPQHRPRTHADQMGVKYRSSLDGVMSWSALTSWFNKDLETRTYFFSQSSSICTIAMKKQQAIHLKRRRSNVHNTWVSVLTSSQFAAQVVGV